jgi:hypothetical protein
MPTDYWVRAKEAAELKARQDKKALELSWTGERVIASQGMIRWKDLSPRKLACWVRLGNQLAILEDARRTRPPAPPPEPVQLDLLAAL